MVSNFLTISKNTTIGTFTEKELAGYVALYKWKKLDEAGGGVYFICNQEDTIKSRNIEEQLLFDRNWHFYF
jgi:hypothetical protein